MKTILQALIDEIHYPVGKGHIQNRLLKRGLTEDAVCTLEIFNGHGFQGAVADCLIFLLGAPNFSESDKQFSMTDKSNILKQANAIYKSIGEPEVTDDDTPMVYVGDCLL